MTTSRQTVRIQSIAAGGDGVGRLDDGRVVFVPRTAPGDVAEVRLTREARRWTRGRVERLAEPSPDRREPPCPFAGRCGGCTLEHLTYQAQLAAKSRIVADALTRIAAVPTEPPEVVASPRQTRYRNRISVTLRRGGHGEVFAGFHDAEDPARVVDIDGRCLLPEPAVAERWDDIRRHWGTDANRLPSGDELRLTLRGSVGGEISLLIEGGAGPGRPEELLTQVPGLISIWHAVRARRPVLLAGEDRLIDRWGGEDVDISGTAFLQVNREAAALLEDHVLTVAGDVAGLRVVDAYCGIGLHARRLTMAGARVTGIEMDPYAVSAARKDAPSGATFVEGTVEEQLPLHLPADLVILNPPRAGVDRRVAEALRRHPPERLVYISCDPATLARDLKRLGDAVELKSIRAFDLFPQTAHVETVVELRPS